VTVKGTYYGSDDELVSKLQGGGDASYDIISPSSDVASYLVDAGLVQPIDTTKISEWKNLSPQLKNLKDVVRDGNVYGMPFCWGPDYLVYNADKVSPAPDSWSIFWDPKYQGKVSLWDDISNLYLVGQLMGWDKNDKSVLYNMSEDQLKQAKQKLIEGKSNVRKYWATAGELNDMFKNGEVYLAVGWPLTPAALNAQGMNIKAVVPKEGATGWIDRLMVTKSTPNKELAMLWLDYVSKPENMALVAKVTNYNVANHDAGEKMDSTLRKELSDNSDYYLQTLNFWQYVKDRKRYNEVWNEVKSTQ
ncbi:MAG: PotD/PotF family extracellular solute-binding protein, partial [Chitinophagales bacterium]